MSDGGTAACLQSASAFAFRLFFGALNQFQRRPVEERYPEVRVGPCATAFKEPDFDELVGEPEGLCAANTPDPHEGVECLARLLTFERHQIGFQFGVLGENCLVESDLGNV